MTAKNDTLRQNPFPGLRAFRPDEGHLFFGRKESTSKVVARLIENRFVAVLGASGSGKSSLVMSGVVPALLNEDIKGTRTWSFVIFRPEQNPVDNLAEQLSALSAGAGFSYLPVSAIAASLHNRSEGLTDVVNKIRKNLRQQIVIVIDQFEEVFRYNPPTSRGTEGDEATDFIDLIVSAVRQPDQGLYVVLTLRSEYVADCSGFHSLTNLLNSGSYLLPQLNRETMVSVIEEPVRISGAMVDRSLVRTIINDLGEKTGQLPVLQHLLMRLWNQWSKSGDLSRPLGMADYEAVGRVKGAISQHAGQAFNSLDERHKYVCARLFRTITTRTEDGKELRRPERISAIVSLTGCSKEEIIKVAEVFRAPEYSFITPVQELALTDDSIIDLTHESIIKLWESLRKWLDEEEASRKLYLQIADAAALHQEGKGKLLTAPEVHLPIKWRNETNPTIAWAERLDPAFERAMLFLKNSEEKYIEQEEHNKKAGRKKVSRSRLFAGLLGLIALIALLVLGTVMTLRVKSEKEKEMALMQKDEVISFNYQLADSLNSLTDTLEAVSDAVNNNRTIIVSALERAKTAEQKAFVAGDLVEEASTAKAEALKAVAEENRLKMIAVGKSLAVRSLNHTYEKDLQILLAWQGYLFNSRYQGAPNDADIYSAFYNIGKRYGSREYAQFMTEDITVTAMAEEPSGNYFYTSETGGRVLRWQADNPSKGYNVIWTGEKLIEVMTVSPDEGWLACGTSTSEIIMIPLKDNNMEYQMSGSGGNIGALVFSSDSDILYSATVRGHVAEWDLTSQTGHNVSQIPSGVTAIDISPDNTYLAGLTVNGKVLVWQIDSGNQVVLLDLGEKVITSLRFVPWDQQLVTGDSSGNIELWNTSDKKISASFEGHGSPVAHIVFNRTQKQMATAGKDGVIKLWDMSDLGEVPPVITDSGNNILKLGFTDNGRALLAATAGTLTMRPSHVEHMTTGLCEKVTRNLTPDEWTAYVGRDIDYEQTCHDEGYRIKATQIKGGQ